MKREDYKHYVLFFNMLGQDNASQEIVALHMLLAWCTLENFCIWQSKLWTCKQTGTGCRHLWLLYCNRYHVDALSFCCRWWYKLWIKWRFQYSSTTTQATPSPGCWPEQEENWYIDKTNPYHSDIRAWINNVYHWCHFLDLFCPF